MTNKKTINIDGLDIEIEQKSIKNIYFRIYKPNGKIKVTAPLRFDFAFIKKLIDEKLGWLKTKVADFQKSEINKEQEKIYFLGEPHEIMISEGLNKMIRQEGTFYFQLKDLNNLLQRQALLDNFYRQELKKLIPELIQKWQPIIQVSVKEWNIKKMKTRWGSCNIIKNRIWLNLKLMQKPLACIEYVLVHEMIHLLEPSHNKRFYALMNQFLPHWKELDKNINHLQHG